MEITSYIIQEGYIMIPVLYILGEIIKQTENINNKYIPLLLLTVSIAFTPFLLGSYDANSFVQSVLVAGATVFSNEIIKNTVGGK